MEIKWKTVGIVGGFGPESTVDFYQRILQYCRTRVKGMRANRGYPRMIIYNCNFIPFEINAENAKKVNPELLSVVKILERAGADFIVIPSNTPYIFSREIASSLSIPLLDIVEETAKEAQRKQIKKAGIIANHPEVVQLYKEHCAPYRIQIEAPDSSSQSRITPLIEGSMAGASEDSSKDFFIELMNEFDRKTDATILACTELPLILGESLKNYRYLDTTQVAVQATVEYALLRD